VEEANKLGLAGEDNQRNISAIALLALFLSFSSFSLYNLTTKPVACFPGDIGTVKCPLVAGTTYPNPSFWKQATSVTLGSGVCTISALYVQGDGTTPGITVTTPSSPPVSNSAVFNLYVLYDFDVHVTLAGTTGKISIYDNIFGLGTSDSREMLVSGVGVGVEESGVLQTATLTVGPSNTVTFHLQIQRTAGAGMFCLDDLEATGYVLAIGGTPA
jgi:hypothetical protein